MDELGDVHDMLFEEFQGYLGFTSSSDSFDVVSTIKHVLASSFSYVSSSDDDSSKSSHVLIRTLFSFSLKYLFLVS